MKRTILAGILLAAPLLTVAAPTYRWVDERGKVHYSDTLPAQQTGKGHRELDKQGRVTQEHTRGAMTPEEREEENERQEQALRHTATQQRRDRALLSTYANTEEINQARMRSNQLAGNKIKSLQTRLEEANSTLKKLTGGKLATDPAARKQSEEMQVEIDSLTKLIAKQEHELKEMNARFDSDVQRYIQLTGKSVR
ncbi:MAG: DUF4124 domain-containing protein [Betaproteobacteria bacterium]|nr:DUF4124 domain-containing protein [Betaproteobacteria bacterium]